MQVGNANEMGSRPRGTVLVCSSILDPSDVAGSASSGVAGSASEHIAIVQLTAHVVAAPQRKPDLGANFATVYAAIHTMQIYLLSKRRGAMTRSPCWRVVGG